MISKPGTYVVGGGLDGMKALTHDQIFGDGWEELGDKLNVRGAYRKQSWLRRCVDLRAKALSAVPHTISRGGEVLFDSEQDVLPEELDWLGDWGSLLYKIDSSLVLEARAYFLKRRRGRRVVGLQWFDPKTIEIQTDTRTGRMVFRRSLNKVQDFSAEDLVHLFHSDVYAELGPGFADGDAARVHADVLQSLNTAIDNILDRGLIRATMITVPRNTPKDEALRLERWWNSVFRGKGHAGRQKVIESEGVKPVVVGDGLSEVGDSNITENQRKAIAAAIGVPYSLLDATSPSNAVKRSDKLDLYDYTIKPTARILEYQLNRQLFRDEGLQFKFDFDRVEVYQSIQLEKAQTVATIVGAPPLTRNEGRRLLGFADLEDPRFDMPLEVVADGFANLEEIGDPSSNNNQAEVALPRDQEIRNWKKKAKRKGRGASFECKELTAEEAETIRLRLDLGEDLESVFQEPFTIY